MDSGVSQKRRGDVRWIGAQLGIRIASSWMILAWISGFAVDARAGDCIDYAEFVHLVGSVDTPGAAYGVAVAGSNAYVAGWIAGISVVDISNPSSPVIVGSIDTPGAAYGVSVNGSYAYVADDFSGLQVVDISNRSSPAIVGSADTPGEARGVAVAGTHVYVADRISGLQVVDVSNPTSPAIVGSADTPSAAYAVAVAGNYAYIADLDSGLQVVDISNPASPAIVRGADLPDFAAAVLVAGNYAYVADNYSGLQILPAQCAVPNAVVLSSFEATPLPGAILLSWSTSFESNHLGFYVHRSIRPDGDYVRVSAELIQPPAPYRFLDTAVSPGIIYHYRLEAISLTGESEFFGPISARFEINRLAQNYPNPFSPRDPFTEIRFDVAARGHATVRLFDPSGRLVRVLLDEVREAGSHGVLWDGRNEEGQGVGSGIYFYRLDAGEFSATRALVRLK